PSGSNLTLRFSVRRMLPSARSRVPVSLAGSLCNLATRVPLRGGLESPGVVMSHGACKSPKFFEQPDPMNLIRSRGRHSIEVDRSPSRRLEYWRFSAWHEEILLLIEGQLEEERIVPERCLIPSLPKVKGNEYG
ncbi:hypothetical protein, partial [Candidatus Methylomirabilis sp.]|uniref:hypothetical protein n=1 Tax=Candidatus Methylomirabilis sp. TaxID=2032687 RepID=UPI002A67CA6D|nr:hypothetical protein [Candidatus Methylomirabilis sp.]